MEAIIGKRPFAPGGPGDNNGVPARFPPCADRLNEVPLLQPVQDGINRALARFQNAGRLGVEVLDHLVTVAGPLVRRASSRVPCCRRVFALESFIGLMAY